MAGDTREAVADWRRLMLHEQARFEARAHEAEAERDAALRRLAVVTEEAEALRRRLAALGEPAPD